MFSLALAIRTGPESKQHAVRAILQAQARVTEVGGHGANSCLLTLKSTDRESGGLFGMYII